MKNFYTALMTLFNKTTGGVHNSFWLDIGGRLYNTRAPEGSALPYCVFLHVAANPDDTFTEKMDEILLQFSIFSGTQDDDTEVQNAMTHLKALFDDCSLSITGGTLVTFTRGAEGLEAEDFETPGGMQSGWHYHVDYHATVRKV